MTHQCHSVISTDHYKKKSVNLWVVFVMEISDTVVDLTPPELHKLLSSGDLIFLDFRKEKGFVNVIGANPVLAEECDDHYLSNILTEEYQESFFSNVVLLYSDKERVDHKEIHEKVVNCSFAKEKKHVNVFACDMEHFEKNYDFLLTDQSKDIKHQRFERSRLLAAIPSKIGPNVYLGDAISSQNLEVAKTLQVRYLNHERFVVEDVFER